MSSIYSQAYTNQLKESSATNREAAKLTKEVLVVRSPGWSLENACDELIPDETTDDYLSPAQRLTLGAYSTKPHSMANWHRVTVVCRSDKLEATSSTVLCDYSNPIAQAKPSLLTHSSYSEVDTDFNFYEYVHQRKYRNDLDWHSRDPYFAEMLRSINLAKSVKDWRPSLSCNGFPSGAVSPAKHASKRVKQTDKVIMLDLDETLVFTEPFVHGKNYSGSMTVCVGPNRTQSFGVFVRPFTQEFLEAISMGHRIVVYTASVQEYAEKIVKIIDPQRVFIDQVLARQHCSFINGLFIKDLSIAINADVKLENVIIVDNFVHSFALHPDHGIPIKPYYGQSEDKELLCLASMLGLTIDYPRLVDFIRTHFDFTNLYQFLEENNDLLA